MALTHAEAAAAPKVLLHDHLDGGLRPQTVIDLAKKIAHPLPAGTADELADWFYEAANSGSLTRYLETFAHTVAVMQTHESLVRVAREAVEDYAADGIVYAETRYAPELFVVGGLSLDEVVDSVRLGIEQGVAVVAKTGRRIIVNQVLCAMRQNDLGDEIADLTLRWRDRGVVGYDIAGPEAGFPPSRQTTAFTRLRDENLPVTIHAGEAAGVESVHEALALCSAERLGHGVRIVEDITETADGVVFGSTAAWVRDRQVPLEVSPSSNLQTGIAATIAQHPFGRLAELDFKVTVNTDNRLVSRTTLTREFELLGEAFDYGLDDVEIFTLNALEAAFVDHDTRLDLLADIVDGFAALRG